MKNVRKALCSILLAGALALGLSACGGSNSGGTAASATATASPLTDLRIAAANQSIILSWTDSTAPTGISSATAPTNTYNIYVSTSPGVKKNDKSGKVTKIPNATSPYAHNGLTNGTPYYYVVTVVSPSGVESVESAELSATPQASLPAAPTGITIAPTDSAIKITLDHSHEPSNIQYNLYWYPTDSSDLTKFHKISNAFPGTTTDYALQGLANSTRYYFYVKADTGNGEGPPSKLLSATPMAQTFAADAAGATQATLGAPFNVKAQNGNGQVVLNWSALTTTNVPPTLPSTYVTADTTKTNATLAYNIYWSMDSPISIPIQPSVVNNKITVTVTTYTPTGLSNNHTYYYLITAVVTPKDINGVTIASPIESDPLASTQLSVVPEAKTPAVPSGLYAVAGNNQVTLGWNKDKSGDTVTYNIYYSTDSSVLNDATPVPSKWKSNNVNNKIYGITTNSQVHSGLYSGTTYYYLVSAQIGNGTTNLFDTSNGESAPSYMISATTLGSK